MEEIPLGGDGGEEGVWGQDRKVLHEVSHVKKSSVPEVSGPPLRRQQNSAVCASLLPSFFPSS